MTTHYLVVMGYPIEFELSVEKSLSQGWKLQGGVSAYVNAGVTHFAQAMTREVNMFTAVHDRTQELNQQVKNGVGND